MSLIKEFTKIIRAAERQYLNTKAQPLVQTEEVGEEEAAAGNFICCGDNRLLMKTLLEEKDMAGKIQMIYIDPPFFTKTDYDAVMKAGDTNIRHKAYGDKWENGLSEYLKMLTVRLYLMRDLLADTGLIWLHLDWHVVHYAKIIMDEIFGEKNFVNEIIWNYKSGGTSKRHFSRKHDTILVYAKSGKYRFYPLKEKSYNRGFKPYRFKGVKEYKDDLGWYTMVNMKDVWNIDMVGRTSRERTGYATQKPEQLIARMIECCTKEGDLCADFFCGSGTLPAAAASMGRCFIGCDKGSLAVESTISRLIEKNRSFRVYRLSDSGKSNLDVRMEASYSEIPGSDMRLLKLSLTSLKVRGLKKNLDEKSRAAVKEVMQKDSVKMVQAWSVDFDYGGAGSVFRSDAVFVRQGESLAPLVRELCRRAKRFA